MLEGGGCHAGVELNQKKIYSENKGMTYDTGLHLVFLGMSVSY